MPGQFDDQWCASTLRLEREGRIVTKQNPNHGIVFLKTPLTEANPYVSFKVTINAHSRGRSNLFVGLVDRVEYTPEHLGNQINYNSFNLLERLTFKLLLGCLE